jgi:phage shock protein E
MSKRSKKAKARSNNRLWLGVGAVIAVIAIAAVVLLSDNTPASTRTASTNNTVSANISPQEYQSQFVDAPHYLLDVRTPLEFDTGHIRGAANIAVETLAGRLSEVPQDKPVVIYCRSGNRSAQAASILREAGYTQVYDLGGVIDWTAAGLPLE